MVIFSPPILDNNVSAEMQASTDPEDSLHRDIPELRGDDLVEPLGDVGHQV